jgi:alpha-mannosidase
MENDRLAVAVSAADGSLSIADKATGFVYEGLNAFVDGGDAGDTYNYSWPPGDRLVASADVKPAWEWLETGPARATLRISWRLAVPEGLAPDRQSRVAREVELVLHSDVSLAAGSARVDIRTHFQNPARDHRLQALFPLGAPIERSSAESAFEVVDRPVALADPGRGWAEPPVAEHPQASFVSVSDGRRGLTIANRGLPEFSAASDGTVALTLLRAVSHLSREDLVTRVGGAGPTLPTPEAQCPGEQVAEYALIPHAGDWDAARVAREAHAFVAPPLAVPHRPQSPPRPRPLPPVKRDLAADGVLVAVEGDVEVTAIKKAEQSDRLIVRVLNESPRPADFRVHLARRPVAAELVDLKEEPSPSGRLEVAADGSVAASARPWQLVTIAFDVER